MAPAKGTLNMTVSHARDTPTGRRRMMTRMESPMTMSQWAVKNKVVVRVKSFIERSGVPQKRKVLMTAYGIRWGSKSNKKEFRV